MPEVFNASAQKAHAAQQQPDESSSSPTDRSHSADRSHRREELLKKTKRAVAGLKQSYRRHLHPLDAVNEYSQVMRNEPRSSNPLDSFAPKPLYVYGFDSQLDNEDVLLLLRQHPITQIGKILAIIGLLFLPLLFKNLDFYTLMPGRFQTAVMLLWYLLTLGIAIESFLTWFYNVYIVTDERIIDVDFLSLIYKNISAAKIDNIEDITATSGGALRALFDFGTIKIQTAAAVTEFEFEDVPSPTKVTQFLNEMLLQEEQEKLEGRVK